MVKYLKVKASRAMILDYGQIFWSTIFNTIHLEINKSYSE